MLIRVLALLMLVLLSATASPYDCECPKGLEHLCRCKVLIDTPVARRQMAFVVSVLHRELPRIFPEREVGVQTIHPDLLKDRGGEPLHGLFDNGKIWVSSGLVREDALAVIAHEYGHLWHFEAHPDPENISDFLAEGFAEWTAYKALSAAGQPDLCHGLRANPDPLYGRSLKWYLAIEEEYGLDAVIDIATTWLDTNGNKVETMNF